SRRGGSGLGSSASYASTDGPSLPRNLSEALDRRRALLKKKAEIEAKMQNAKKMTDDPYEQRQKERELHMEMLLQRQKDAEERELRERKEKVEKMRSQGPLARDMTDDDIRRENHARELEQRRLEQERWQYGAPPPGVGTGVGSSVGGSMIPPHLRDKEMQQQISQQVANQIQEQDGFTQHMKHHTQQGAAQVAAARAEKQLHSKPPMATEFDFKDAERDISRLEHHLSDNQLERQRCVEELDKMSRIQTRSKKNIQRRKFLEQKIKDLTGTISQQRVKLRELEGYLA
ncbi:hypothetical protein ADUPG1_009822, partial [Aduncisulcus paluster]